MVIKSMIETLVGGFDREAFAASYPDAICTVRGKPSAGFKPEGANAPRTVTFAHLYDQLHYEPEALEITYTADDTGISAVGPLAAQFAQQYGFYHADRVPQPLRVPHWFTQD